MPTPTRMRLGRIALLGADIAITAGVPCVFLHAMPSAAATLVDAWDAPCPPVLVPAAIAVVWLMAVAVLWRSTLHTRPTASPTWSPPPPPRARDVR